MSDEDTDDDARLRLIAGSTWSGWASGTMCLSHWQQRTSGYSFEYVEGQFQVIVSNYTPSTTYTLTVDVYERVYGTGSYTLVGQMMTSVTTDSSGNATVVGDVPMNEGYDKYVSNPVLT
ncbi:MAG: hypothetical protein JSR30_00045 [Proteobacteria bacterium]|nr:hypothetical protein [Pseudomonadota bacterium]